MWPRTGFLELLGLTHPIVQAPMSGFTPPGARGGRLQCRRPGLYRLRGPTVEPAVGAGRGDAPDDEPAFQSQLFLRIPVRELLPRRRRACGRGSRPISTNLDWGPCRSQRSRFHLLTESCLTW
jgi:hypothetical protein